MQTEENALFRFSGYSPSHFHRQHSPVVSFSHSAKDARRSNKPIMEKRRRARINHCLAELKTLILEAMKKDPARHSKLEKADILEMTVKHLQTVQRQQMAIAVATDPTVMTKFRSGFNDCATEVVRYVSRMDGVDPGVSQRLMGHIRNCLTSLNHLSPPFNNFVAAPQLHPAWFYTSPPTPTTNTHSSLPNRFAAAFETARANNNNNNPEVTESKFRMEKAESGKIKQEADDSAAEIIFDAQKDKRGGGSSNAGSPTSNGSSSTPKPSTSTDADKMWRPW